MLNFNDPDVLASWAAEPSFYNAPHPPGVVPRQYQHAGVEYHLARDNALFGDAPGLGKTPECVMLSNAIQARRTLVVCPASLRLNWEREVWRWSTIPNVRTYPILQARDGVSPEAHYVIISYDLLRSEPILRALLTLRWDHLILDEGHYLKDPGGNKRTRAICAEDGLRSVAGRITLASGAILPNQPIECYNAIRLLNWDAIDRASLEDFREAYYEYGEGFVVGYHSTTDARGQPVRKRELHWSNRVRNVPVNLDDLRWRLRKHVMVRRLKEHVLKELPPKQWHVFPLAPTTAMQKALRSDAWREVTRLYELDPRVFDSDIPVEGAVSTAYRELGEATAPAIAEYVLELLKEGVEKVVVGAWHRNVLRYLREKLRACGLAYMDGSTSPARKQAEVDRFQKNEGVRVILGQVGPLGEGWTLTAAQDVVLAEPYWVPGKNDQLLERVHRIGQTGTRVIGHMPFVPGSLHERIIARVAEKDASIYQALDGQV